MKDIIRLVIIVLKLVAFVVICFHATWWVSLLAFFLAVQIRVE